MQTASHILFVDAGGKHRRYSGEFRPVFAKVDEVIEGDFRSTFSFDVFFVRADSNPVYGAGNSIAGSLGTDSADPNDSVVSAITYRPHAIKHAEATIGIWIAIVRAFVDEYARGFQGLRLFLLATRAFSCGVQAAVETFIVRTLIP